MKPAERFKTTKVLTCLLFFSISFYIILSSFYLPIVTAVILAGLIIFAIRTTIVTWITVLVLLAFAGKRRRVLVKEGRTITSDVALYLAQVVLNEKSLVAVGFATFLSLMAMVIG